MHLMTPQWQEQLLIQAKELHQQNIHSKYDQKIRNNVSYSETET